MVQLGGGGGGGRAQLDTNQANSPVCIVSNIHIEVKALSLCSDCEHPHTGLTARWGGLLRTLMMIPAGSLLTESLDGQLLLSACHFIVPSSGVWNLISGPKIQS